ncbi:MULTISPECIES: hypothetical protein [Clostridium]|uniref:Uncharacterized protein n=2 Tax=Clostridium TaxID=1485 RepID=A0AA47I5V4_9CLOT|nr:MULTISPECIES: hypothetical protein [Clostridium]MBU3102380.1 hypothetical protein [Clostridium sp. DSM 17811]MBU3155019.1 hypothetical protein [Clostridium estertheticum]MBU3176482.1 hypothetical protein [Clostridium estertheticum]MBU3201750.1 hypothetical protein [Clostridium estertheticum]MBX4261573.1 hypothetical protein [Clostridium estertheticum]
MIKLLKKVFSKENMRNVGVLNYVVSTGGSKDAIMLYNEIFNKNDNELNLKKVS